MLCFTVLFTCGSFGVSSEREKTAVPAVKRSFRENLGGFQLVPVVKESRSQCRITALTSCMPAVAAISSEMGNTVERGTNQRVKSASCERKKNKGKKKVEETI